MQNEVGAAPKLSQGRRNSRRSIGTERVTQLEIIHPIARSSGVARDEATSVRTGDLAHDMMRR
jgi:hypothetical protein